MSTATAIEWTEVTWNPVTGCDRISPGCDNCYALTLARRLKAIGQAKYQTDGDPRTSGPGYPDDQHASGLAAGRATRQGRCQRKLVGPCMTVGRPFLRRHARAAAPGPPRAAPL